MTKIAEALIERAGLQQRLKALKERIDKMKHTEEGDAPIEDIADLVNNYVDLTGELGQLIFLINKANVNTMTSEGSIAELIEKRDSAVKVKNVFESLANEVANERSNIYNHRSKEDVKYVLTYNPKDYRAKADGLAKVVRELDSLLQQTNWQTDI